VTRYTDEDPTRPAQRSNRLTDSRRRFGGWVQGHQTRSRSKGRLDNYRWSSTIC